MVMGSTSATPVTVTRMMVTHQERTANPPFAGECEFRESRKLPSVYKRGESELVSGDVFLNGVSTSLSLSRPLRARRLRGLGQLLVRGVPAASGSRRW